MRTAAELRADADYLNDCCVDIHAVAVEEERDLSEDEQTRFDEGIAERDRLRVEAEKAEQREAAIAAGRTTRGDNFQPYNVNTRESDDPFDMRDVSILASPSELISRAQAAIEKMPKAEGLDAARENAAKLLTQPSGNRLLGGFDAAAVARHVLATGSEAYRGAFSKVISGQDFLLTEDEKRAIVTARAASLTTTAGGFAVPFTLDPTLILTNDGTANSIRQISRVVQITTDQWNGVSTAGITAGYAAEASEVGDDAPTLAQPSITVQRGDAFVPFSFEIGMDWPGFQADVAMLFADARDRADATAFTTGTGTNEPIGIVTALTGGASEISSATTDIFAVADVYSTFETTPPRHRSRSSWLANIAIINDVRQFATANNYHGFTVDLTAAGIPQLLGRPVYETSDMDGTVNALAENYVLINGDFNDYVIVDRVGMSVELVPHLFATGANRPDGQRGLLAWWRTGADSVNDNAFTMLNVT